MSLDHMEGPAEAVCSLGGGGGGNVCVESLKRASLGSHTIREPRGVRRCSQPPLDSSPGVTDHRVGVPRPRGEKRPLRYQGVWHWAGSGLWGQPSSGRGPGTSADTGCAGPGLPAGIPTATITPVVLWHIWRPNLFTEGYARGQGHQDEPGHTGVPRCASLVPQAFPLCMPLRRPAEPQGWSLLGSRPTAFSCPPPPLSPSLVTSRMV